MNTATRTATSAVLAAAVIATAAVLLIVFAGVEKESMEIRSHPSAQEISVGAANPAAEELVRRIVTRLEAADDVLRLAVDEELIRELRRGRSVELFFEPPRELTLQYNGRQLAVRALLLPLEGKMAYAGTVLFYATGDGYSSCPLSHRGRTDIEELAAEVASL